MDNYAFHVMVKPRGAVCNLNCQYCFYLPKEKLYPGSSLRMSDELLESFTRQFIQAQKVPEVVFAWQGGEPTLMGLDFFRRAIELQQKYRKPGMKILNTFQTNATLLNDDWCQFFRENNFLIGASLDGPRDLHDTYRVDKGGQPTFDRVMEGVELLKRNRVEFNILACVNNLSAQQPLEVYRFFRDEVGTHYIQFIPIVEPTGKVSDPVSTRSVSATAYGRFLSQIFDEWVRRDVGRMSVQIFDTALAVWAGLPPGLCVFEETCGLALAMEHNGDVYSCDHFVDQDHYLGNMQQQSLTSLVSAPRQQVFGKNKKDALPQKCKECHVYFVCHGGCPKDRLLESIEGEPSVRHVCRNYLCEGYKAFFTHIDKPMRVIASLLQSGRDPVEIMSLLPPTRRKRHLTVKKQIVD